MSVQLLLAPQPVQVSILFESILVMLLQYLSHCSQLLLTHSLVVQGLAAGTVSFVADWLPVLPKFC